MAGHVASLITTKLVWADDSWWAFGGFEDPVIVRHVNGTTNWIQKTNDLTDPGAEYQCGIVDGDYIWTGPGYADVGGVGVCTYNIATDTWTNRDSVARSVVDLCFYGDTVAVTDVDTSGETDVARILYWAGSTTWTTLGGLGSGTVCPQILEVAGELYALETTTGDIYQYQTGTTWTATSIPFVPLRMAQWNNTLVVAGTATTNGLPVVWKYDGSTWTQLGDNLSALNAESFQFIAEDINNTLYAIPELEPGAKDYDYWYKYSEPADEWSVQMTSDYKTITAGEFNPDYEAGFGRDEEAAAGFFRDLHYDDADSFDGHRWQI